MKTLTQHSKIREASHIHEFRELFGADTDIDETILTRQREIFGFSLFLFHSNSVYEALKIGFLNSRNVFEQTKSILSIPHTYIFGGIALGPILKIIGATWLFLPIFIGIILLSIFPAYRIIRDKVELYKKSRIFFNIDIKSAEIIKNEFLKLHPFKHKPMIWKQKGGGTMDGNSTGGKLFLYLFSQPFIFLHLQFFGGIPITTLIAFDIILGCILFGIFEKLIFLFFAGFYTVYFYIFDKFPILFSREDQERDFYMDLYRRCNSLLDSMDKLEEDMVDLKENGNIQPTLSKNLSTTIEEIGILYSLIEKNSHLLVGKEKFQSFLKNMLNEIIIIYTYVFEFFSERINTISMEISTSGIDEKQRDYLLKIIKPILDTRKEQLMKMKQHMLEQLIT